MADMPMRKVVVMSEGVTEDGERRLGISPLSREGSMNAAAFLVARMYTDAVFSNDIRTIQLIINRIDGGLPKDTEVDNYQTKFSDCLSTLMEMPHGNRLKVTPDDTVMMALCKSLYSLATQDIYWDEERGRMRRPSMDRKQERDSALRMILERTGGRKTLVSATEVREEVESADWVASLPSGV